MRPSFRVPAFVHEDIFGPMPPSRSPPACSSCSSANFLSLKLLRPNDHPRTRKIPDAMQLLFFFDNALFSKPAPVNEKWSATLGSSCINVPFFNSDVLLQQAHAADGSLSTLLSVLVYVNDKRIKQNRFLIKGGKQVSKFPHGSCHHRFAIRD